MGAQTVIKMKYSKTTKKRKNFVAVSINGDKKNNLCKHTRLAVPKDTELGNNITVTVVTEEE